MVSNILTIRRLVINNKHFEGSLYKQEYLTNNKYRYRYSNIQSLVKFYESLCFDKYRYTVTFLTLKYSNQPDHNPTNIQKLLKHLNKYHVDKHNNNIPVHSVWKLEYREQTKLQKNKAGGYHYHIALITNRDITPSNKKLVERVRKQWKWGKAHVSSHVHQTPMLIDSYEGAYGKTALNTPTCNTDTTSIAGVFHHLSYLAKDDPNQKLPEDYKGKSFNISKVTSNKLTGHKAIKQHLNNSRPKIIKVEDWMLDDYSVVIPLNEELQIEFDNIELPF